MKSYSTSMSMHGGVVTQVIGAVVDVQVKELHMLFVVVFAM